MHELEREKREEWEQLAASCVPAAVSGPWSRAASHVGECAIGRPLLGPTGRIQWYKFACVKKTRGTGNACMPVVKRKGNLAGASRATHSETKL